MKHLSVWIIGLLGLTLGLLVAPVVAQLPNPTISVNPVWRPATQLDSFLPNDLRYVEAEINVTTNTQFWAVSLSCMVNKLALEGYVVNTSNGDTGDDVPMVYWNANGVWGNTGDDFTFVNSPYNAAAGSMSFTASRLEPNAPIGQNGPSNTFLLATLRYRVKDLTANATSPLTCTGSFLDKNGRSIVTPVVTAPTPVQLLTGYSLRGNVKYQAHASHAGINVVCTGPSTQFMTTDAAGNYVTNNLRDDGLFNCVYSAGGPLTTRYLHAQTQVEVVSSSFSPPTIPEIILKGGNTTATGSPDGIMSTDLSILTGSFGNTVPKDTSGDVNGDGKVNQNDLAVLTSNYQRYEMVDARHLLFGISRNSAAFADSRAWLGIVDSNAVSQFIPGTAKIYWPTLSPDGTRVAYVQEVTALRSSPFTLPRYALFVGPAAGTTGTTTRLTPTTWSFDAFAPSWSPDGAKIAFICSANQGSNAEWYYSGTGNLCWVDVTGRNLITGSYAGEIQRPAWISDNQFVYAAPSNQLNQFNLVDQTSVSLANIGNSGNASNPVYEDGLLFYQDAASGSIYVTNYNGYPYFVPPYNEETPGYYHMSTGLSNGYSFDVSEHGLSIVVDYDYGSYQVYSQIADLTSSVPAYSYNQAIQVDGAVGTPYILTNSYGWALRNSVDFAW